MYDYYLQANLVSLCIKNKIKLVSLPVFFLGFISLDL